MRCSLCFLLVLGCAGAPRPVPRVPSCTAVDDPAVLVIGEVRVPGRYVGAGLTLEESLALAGGLTPLAQRRSVAVRRQTAEGVRAFTVDLDGASPVVLCAGDVVSVARGGD